ncbi:MAG TPA: PilZ domain-containing protein [Candidatus Acidoferrum sp.]|nr:PilZ domain-containing protein [Candidatus Acidoferrum sp.]
MAEDRRQTRRLIMRVPMRVRRLNRKPEEEQSVESLNISAHGVYFASETKFEVKDDLELRLHMPEQLMAGQKAEWQFVGRVAHVEELRKNGVYGVGVQFLYYSATRMKREADAGSKD